MAGVANLEFMEYKLHDSVAVLTINRPKVNALNSEVLRQLKTAVKGAIRTEAVSVIVITGAGRAFVAGADISEMKDMSPLKAREFAALGQGVFNYIEQAPKPIIAAVNGYALGGGCELAMACDLRIAAKEAVFGQPEVKLGVLPGFGGTQRLARLVGAARAKELIFTGKNLAAGDAEAIGLVNRVVEADSLMEGALELARVIAAQGPVAIKGAKEAINRGLQVDMATGSALEAELFARCFSTEDQKEGMAAFLAKRAPEFKGH